MIQYRQFRPSERVAKFVECYWTLEMDDPTPEQPVQRIVPDGCTELIINLAEPFENRDIDGNWKTQPRCFFAGQITGPLLLRPSGRANMIGIRFRPHGASQGLRLPVDELRCAFTALDEILPRFWNELQCVYDAKHSSARLLAAMEKILTTYMDHAGREDRQISAAVALATYRRGIVGVGDLADFAGMSSRQLERRFNTQIGISPKLFCRMLRFQRVFKHTESDDPEWPSIALACGYYDQAHLIRDFKQFSGETPSALLAPDTDLAEHFLKHKRMSHSSKTTPVCRT